MRLRYKGVLPITFLLENIGTVEPDAEFDVSDELAPAFLSRKDIEQVKVTKTRRAKDPVTEPTATDHIEAAAAPTAETEPTL